MVVNDRKWIAVLLVTVFATAGLTAQAGAAADQLELPLPITKHALETAVANGLLGFVSNPVLRSAEEVELFQTWIRELLEWSSEPENLAEIRNDEDVLHCIIAAMNFSGITARARLQPVILGEKLWITPCHELSQQGYDFFLDEVWAQYQQVASQWTALTGLDVPDGYFFFRVYPTSGAIQRDWDLGENVGAVTLYCRLVAVPVYQFTNSRGDYIRDKTYLRRSLRHEMVHALHLSHAGFHLGTKADDWFSEGLAVYVGDDPIVVGHRSTRGEKGGIIERQQTVTTSDEYRVYVSLFEFLEDRYGHRKLGRFIRDAVNEPDTTAVLQRHFGYGSFHEAQKHGRMWQGFHNRANMNLFGLGLAAIITGFVSIKRVLTKHGTGFYFLILFMVAVINISVQQGMAAAIHLGMAPTTAASASNLAVLLGYLGLGLGILLLVRTERHFRRARLARLTNRLETSIVNDNVDLSKRLLQDIHDELLLMPRRNRGPISYRLLQLRLQHPRLPLPW